MANRKRLRLLYRLIGWFILAFCWGCGNQQPEIALTAIHILPAGHAIPLGRSLQLSAIGTFSNNSNRDISGIVLWNSSDINVADISNESNEKGLLKTIRKGHVDITATTPGNTICGKTELTIMEPVLEFISVIPPQASIHLGKVQQFQAIGHFSDNSTSDMTTVVNWSSPDTFPPTVSNTQGSKGLCLSPAVGRIFIVATDSVSGIQGSAVLSLSDARLTAIDIVPANHSLPLGSSYPFIAKGYYNDGSTNDITSVVSWSSSNPLVASASNSPSSKGMVTAIAIGSANIKAVDPGFIISGAVQLNITAPELLHITILDPAGEIIPGQPVQLTAMGRLTDGHTMDLTNRLDWHSTDSEKAAVDNTRQKGLVSPLRPGQTIVQVVDKDTGLGAILQLLIALPHLTALYLEAPDKSLCVGDLFILKATGTFSDGSRQDVSSGVEWSSSAPDIARICDSEDGRRAAMPISPGMASIAATHPKSGANATATLTIEPAKLSAITISPENQSVALGKQITFEAIGTYSDKTTKSITDQVTWHSSNQSTALVGNDSNGKGTIHSKSTGTVTISASYPPYEARSETVLTILPPELITIELAPINPKLLLGGTHQFRAIGKFSDGEIKDITMAVSWTSSDEAVATIGDLSDNKGSAAIKTIGYCDIIATDPGSGLSGKTGLSSRVNW